MSYFQPNCTLPPEGINYVASPNIRTTLDILWSSLATIIACTWSVLHLNVPEQRRGRDPGWRGDMKWSLRRFWRKLKWCIITVLAPEFIFTKAINDWIHARKQLRKLHRERPDTTQQITMVLMMFANMGGFVLRYHPTSSDRKLEQSSDVVIGEAQHPGQNLLPRSSEDAGGRGLATPSDLESSSGGGPLASHHETDALQSHTELWHLDAEILRRLIADKHIPLDDLPHAEDIADKSKSDFLTRTIILMQVCYFVVSVLVRVSNGLAISELEIGTVAFVLCSTLTYLTTFSKPKSVETAIVLPEIASANTVSYLREHARKHPMASFSSSKHLGEPPRNDPLFTIGGSFIATDTWALVISATLFSSVHIAGWNLTFPSVTDMWLWRASAVATTVSPALVLAAWMLISEDGDRITTDLVSALVLLGLALLYAVARLILIVEMFRGLAYLPPKAFEATWTANVPHIG